MQEGRQVSGTVEEWTLCVRAWVWVSDVSMRRTQWCVCVYHGREGWEVRVSSQGWRCTESSSQSGQVIGVLSVSWSSELLLSFSAPRNTSTPDPLLMRTTSNPLTHMNRRHTLCVLLQLSQALSIQHIYMHVLY